MYAITGTTLQARWSIIDIQSECVLVSAMVQLYPWMINSNQQATSKMTVMQVPFKIHLLYTLNQEMVPKLISEIW